jgi:hypothetical protein
MSNRNELYKLSLEKHMNELLSASRSYDKSILSLTTATLGFTIAFIKILHHINGDCLLLFSWFFLISAIVLILFSFLIYQVHHEHRTKYYFSKILSNEDEISKAHWSDN